MADDRMELELQLKLQSALDARDAERERGDRLAAEVEALEHQVEWTQGQVRLSKSESLANLNSAIRFWDDLYAEMELADRLAEALSAVLSYHTEEVYGRQRDALDTYKEARNE